MAPENRRQNRLAKEWIGLQTLNRESDMVKVEAVEVLPGLAPEKYKVTYRCRGIVGIDGAKNAVYGEMHQVQIYCHAGFPADVPWLKWLTPIWHPNIEHDGERRVCVNKAEWLGGMSVADLCQLMFEMVQYKNYHAEMTPPFPLDREAANWVREYAEPRGIVDKKRNLFVDSQMFRRGTPKPVVEQVPAQGMRIRIGGMATASEPVKEPVSVGRVKFHAAKSESTDSAVVMEAGAGSRPCPRCAAEMPAEAAFCGACGAGIGRMAASAGMRN